MCVAALLAIVLTADTARAQVRQASLRCGSWLVQVGARLSDVLAACGPPTDRSPTRHVVTFQQTGLGLEEIVIHVKRWLYDRGPGQFVRVLTFRNGHVDTIALAGYGEP
jgi:Protein of unknown function (DUF2845)